jgi:hypothetical protein
MKSWWSRRGRWERWVWVLVAIHITVELVTDGLIVAALWLALDVVVIYVWLAIWEFVKRVVKD